MSKKKKQPTLTQIRAMLATCAFDPREPGPMRAIVETDSISYLRDRAMEFLRSAEQVTNRHEYCQSLKKAISLLALELVKDDLFNGHTPPGTRKPTQPMLNHPATCGGQGTEFI